MSETLATSIGLSLTGSLAQSGSFGIADFELGLSELLAASTTNGSATADKANQLMTLQRTLGAAEADSLNLYSWLLNGLPYPATDTATRDPLGNTVTMATIKLLVLKICGNLGCGFLSAATVNNAGTGYTNGTQTFTLLGGIYVGSVVIHAAGGGSGYVVGDVLTLAGGTGTAATVQVLTVSSGAILTLAVKTRGAYSVTPTATSNGATGGTGTGASLDVTAITSPAATISCTVTGGSVTAVLSVLTPGSYVALPAATGCTSTGPAGSGATFNLTLGTRTTSDAVFTEADYLTVGGVGTTAGWTSILSPNTATRLQKSGTTNLPGVWLETDGGATGYVVGASTTNNILKLVNSGSSPVTYQLVVVGATS